jgi:hypothetical protein
MIVPAPAVEENKVTVVVQKTQFVLMGFSQVMGSRVFAFQGVAADKTRTLYTVRADLALAQRYGIRLQELPLLCRAVLERCSEGTERRAFSYSESDMCLYANSAMEREQAAKIKKSRRSGPNSTVVDQAPGA